MATPILDITELANNQRHQFATANQAFRDLEAAANDFVAVDLSSSDVTLTASEFRSGFLFRASGHTVGRNLTVPQQKRFFAVNNTGTAVVSVVRGASSSDVQAGTAGIFYTDGTADGLVAIASGGGGSRDTFDTATISGGAVDLTEDSVSVWVVELTENVTSISLPSTEGSDVLPIIVLFIQDSSGGRTVTGWSDGPIWEGGSEPTVSSSASTVTSVPLLILGDGTVYGVS